MSHWQKPFTIALVAVVAALRATALAAPQATTPPAAQTLQTTKPKPAEPQTILLWPDGAPGVQGDTDADKPSVTVYHASSRQPDLTGVIVAPGGSYTNLAMNHEGRQVANLLNAAGITAFVLKYRLGPRYRHPIEIGDAQRAIRLVRARAWEFGVAPDRIGMLGFSAGGHLTATAGTRFDAGRADASDPIERVSSRPDFLVLAYPVISFDPAIAHSGSVRNLLGDPDEKMREDLSADRQVTAQTPPTFLFHTDGDTGVVPENSVRFYLALRRAKVPAELHIFEKGPHGVGLAMSDPALSQWPALLLAWLRGRGLLTPAAR
jgi:acetyl esterase/lipase